MAELITFRPIDIEDIRILDEMEKSIFPGIEYKDETWRYFLRNTESSIMALKNGKAIGYVVSCFLHQNTAEYTPYMSATGYIYHIVSLGVLSEYKNQGIGTRLLNMCIDKAFKIPLKYISLHVMDGNMHAMHIYKKRGFKFGFHVDGYYESGEGGNFMYLNGPGLRVVRDEEPPPVKE